jgi:urease accessory protein
MTDPGGLTRLLSWLSPSFPVGAYSYSHGLEYAVEAGLVRNAGDLRGWIDTALRHGTGHVDAVLFAAAHAATCNPVRLADVFATAAVFRGTAELALESAAQGRAFLATVRAAWPAPELDEADALCRSAGIEPAYAPAVAVACAAHGVPLEPSLAAFLHAFAANLVSAGVRLIPLGQTDGQRTIAALEGPIRDAADAALATDLDEVGTAAPVIDLCSMAHETQYTRLFRS